MNPLTPNPLDQLVDAIAAQIIDRITPALTEAAESRRLPALAVSVAEASRALSLSDPIIRRLVREGHLTVVAGVDATRITVASLHAYAGHPLLPQLHEVAS